MYIHIFLFLFSKILPSLLVLISYFNYITIMINSNFYFSPVIIIYGVDGTLRGVLNDSSATDMVGEE